MFTFFVFNIFLILMICALIAIISAVPSKLERMKDFLFSGNNAYLSVFSNVGSILSLAMIFSVYLVAVRNYGLISSISVFLGIVIAYICINKGYKIVLERDGNNEKYQFTTYSTCFNSIRIKNLIRINVLLQYLICIITEYAVLISFLKGFLPEDANSSVYLALLIAFLCSTYVSLGGYSGVLRTDFFQVGIFSLGLIVTLIYCWPQTINTIEQSIIVENFDFRGPLDLIDFFTLAAFTAAAFLGFPDVWIRNMTTFRRNKGQLKSIKVSGILLSLTVFPLTLIAITIFNNQLTFSHEYYVGPTFNEFIKFALSSIPFLGENTILFGLLISGFVCIFVTTVDTWLISIMQNLYMTSETKEVNNFILLSPFFISVLCVFVADNLSKDYILSFCLFLFPFLFFNTIVFLSVVSIKINKIITFPMLFIPFITSFFLVLVFVIYYWNELELHAGDSIFFPAIILYVFFYIGYKLKIKNVPKRV